MNLRHLHCFVTLAEELHFGRAAERLHIEQSPLSRAIKKLESELGVVLLDRTPQGTRLTWAGEMFLEDTRRILTAVEQATANVKATAMGFRGRLRIALSDSIAQARLSALLALSREEEPDIEIRLFEMPLSQQERGLRQDLYDAGFTLSDKSVDGLVTIPVWQDPIVVVLPARHPLLIRKQVPLEAVLAYPLVLCHPEACVGCNRQLEHLLHSVDMQPIVAERVTTHDLMLTLIAAGYGVGFTSAANVATYRHHEVIARPLDAPSATFTTFLLRPKTAPSDQLSAFLDRASRVGSIPVALSR